MTKKYLKMADEFSLPVEDGTIEVYCRQHIGESFESGEMYAAHAINSHDELVAEVERLREFERDAMRYRFLRECHWNGSPLCVVVDPKKMVKIGADCPTTTRLDDAIDEMLA